MGTFSNRIEISDPSGERFEQVEALVDTGARYTVVPGALLRSLGIGRHTTEDFKLADGRITQMDIGQTWVRIDGRSVITLVVFGDEDARSLLGAYTLEGLALSVDPSNQRLIPTRRLLM